MLTSVGFETNAVALGQMRVTVQEKLTESEAQITQRLGDDHHIEIQEVADPTTIVSEILEPGSDPEPQIRKKTVQEDRSFSLSY